MKNNRPHFKYFFYLCLFGIVVSTGCKNPSAKNVSEENIVETKEIRVDSELPIFDRTKNTIRINSAGLKTEYNGANNIAHLVYGSENQKIDTIILVGKGFSFSPFQPFTTEFDWENAMDMDCNTPIKKYILGRENAEIRETKIGMEFCERLTFDSIIFTNEKATKGWFMSFSPHPNSETINYSSPLNRSYHFFNCEFRLNEVQYFLTAIPSDISPPVEFQSCTISEPIKTFYQSDFFEESQKESGSSRYESNVGWDGKKLDLGASIPQ